MADNDLTPQEQRLIDCAAKGTWWGPKRSEIENQLDADPCYAYGWDASRTLRADLIRCLAAGEKWPDQKKPWPVSSKGLQIQGAKISGPLDLEGATLKQTLWLHHCAFDGPVALMDAETRTVSLSCSYLPDGLEAQRSAIKGDLRLCDGFSAKSEVNLTGAKIEGQLACDGGHFENSTGPALNASAMTVGADVFLRDGFSAKGGVNLVRAKIDGQLSCVGGNFENAKGRALNANSLSVGASVLLSNNFNAKGEVNLAGAKIGGPLGCDGGHFENSTGSLAFNADAISVGADAFLRDGFSAKGVVNLYRATINGNLRCEESSFANAGGDALVLTLADIGGGLFLRGLKPVQGRKHGLEGRLILEQTKCHTYCDDLSAWPEQGKLVLDGFSYEGFHDCDTGWKTRREWLERQEPEHLRDMFRPQPWTHAINVLKQMGHDTDARDLAIARELARARSKNTPFWRKLWIYALTLFVGNGYKPWRAFWWSVGFILAGWIVFASAGALGYMAPRDGNVRVTDAWNQHHQLPQTYPPFNGLVYALDAYLPVIELGQDETWEPSTKKTISTIHAAPDRVLLRAGTLPEWFFAAGWHRVVYWISEFLGWIFISLFIAGMSGLMKKE